MKPILNLELDTSNIYGQQNYSILKKIISAFKKIFNDRYQVIIFPKGVVSSMVAENTTVVNLNLTINCEDDLESVLKRLNEIAEDYEKEEFDGRTEYENKMVNNDNQ